MLITTIAYRQIEVGNLGSWLNNKKYGKLANWTYTP
jgi:hypothetical protein